MIILPYEHDVKHFSRKKAPEGAFVLPAVCLVADADRVQHTDRDCQTGEQTEGTKHEQWYGF
jgi:hypothetical protein